MIANYDKNNAILRIIIMSFFNLGLRNTWRNLGKHYLSRILIISILLVKDKSCTIYHTPYNIKLL